MVADGEYEDINDALRDTWISNYVYTYDKDMKTVYVEVANSITKMCSNDMDIIREVMSGMGIRDYKDASAFYNILVDVAGFDGFETEWTDSETGKKSRIHLALSSNQVKLVSNEHPTENEDIRYSSKVDKYDNLLSHSEYKRLIEMYDKPHGKSDNGEKIYIIDKVLAFCVGNKNNIRVTRIIEFEDAENKNSITIPAYAQTDLINLFKDYNHASHGQRVKRINIGDFSQDEQTIIENAFHRRVNIKQYFGYRHLTFKGHEYGTEDRVRRTVSYHFEDEQDGRRNSEKVSGYEEIVPGKLGFTDERIDKLLGGGYYGSSNPIYAQAYITYMSPKTFLKLTTGKNQRYLNRVEDWKSGWGDVGEFDFEKMVDGDNYNFVPIQLSIDENTRTVVGHEGRHRMVQLQKLGYNKVPVLLFDSMTKNSKEAKDAMILYPQVFDEDVDNYDALEYETLRDVIPFSSGNREIIKQKFGSGSKAERLFSERVQSEDYFSQSKRLEKENAKLKEDIARLTRRLRLEKVKTDGKVLDKSKGERLAEDYFKGVLPFFFCARKWSGLHNWAFNIISKPKLLSFRRYWLTHG